MAGLFARTIGWRLVRALLGLQTPEAADASGTFQTIVHKRPASSEAQARADYECVRADLVRIGSIKDNKTQWIVVCVVFAIVVGNVVRFGGPQSWIFLLGMVPILLLIAAVLGYLHYLRSTRLMTDERHIADAWLRLGCCPHCAYRLPEQAHGTIVRCSECGVAWRMPGRAA